MLHNLHSSPVSKDSSIGIATHCGLNGPGIESWWGCDFLCLSRPDLGLTQPPLQWVLVLFSGIKQLGCCIDHIPPYGTKIKERVDLYLFFPSGPSWPILR